jgi:hypothetical protein
MSFGNLQDIAALAAPANGIIPADESDAGAAAVHAGATLAEKVRAGINASILSSGTILDQIRQS